ncbi:MAG: hypothetical protein WBA57_19045 [Elainellaceae cyanobacterium]
MNPSQDSSSPPPDDSQPNDADPSKEPQPTELSEVEQSLNDVEESLASLKRRYADVLAAKAQRSELIAQYNRTQDEVRRHRTPKLKSELNDLQQKINEVEIALESQLFSWSSLKEPFWMGVRFGGLGVLVGWLLRAAAG